MTRSTLDAVALLLSDAVFGSFSIRDANTSELDDTCKLVLAAHQVAGASPWKIIPFRFAWCAHRRVHEIDVIVTRRWRANDRFHKIARVGTPCKTSTFALQEAAIERFAPEAEFSRSLHRGMQAAALDAAYELHETPPMQIGRAHV